MHPSRTNIPLPLLLLLLLALCLTPALAHAEEADGGTIYDVHFSVATPYCGQTVSGDGPQQNGPQVSLAEDGVQQGDRTFWVGSYFESPDDATPFTGTIEGGRNYQALVSIEAADGYRFDTDTRVFLHDDKSSVDIQLEIVQRRSDQLVVLVTKAAQHEWDPSKTTKTEPTCTSPGEERKVCRTDDSHVDIKETPADPEAHEWGDWQVVKEASREEQGERMRTCALCGSEQWEAIPRTPLPYTQVYEPDTSWPMAATIAWRADANAVDVAAADVRPATTFVWLDRNLKVYDRNGGLLSDDIAAYVEATVSGTIPAFYIEDAETAAALKEWLHDYGLQDCFVVSTPQHKDLVKDVADLLHVRGMLDYTQVTKPSHSDLLNMIASVNGAHGKVVLLSQQAATREAIQMLQRLAATVWVQASADTKTLLTLYTNGVNGVVVNNYAAAVRTQELIDDDEPSLLRLPLIIGHRGDPSGYVENTLDSARAAYEGGADAVENDILLSSDNELYILHGRFFGHDELNDRSESYLLEELRNRIFSWDDLITHNEVPSARSRTGQLYGQSEGKEYTVPTLREYLEEFEGTSVVHDTEIKSHNPAIIPVFKALVDEYDAWDQVFTITFNVGILNAIYHDYPEISVGALGTNVNLEADVVGHINYDDVVSEVGVEGAVAQLYGVLDQWNSTYNPMYPGFGAQMVSAARHRGLTVWPWTYGDTEDFARDYLRGVTGMTTDWPWVAANYVVEIPAEDVTVDALDDVPRPQGKTQDGGEKDLGDAELVELEWLSDAQVLMIWRYKATMDVNGTSYGSYYLYSNPFVVTLAHPSHEHAWDEPSYSWSADGTLVTASRVCKTCGGMEHETVQVEDGVARFENAAFGTKTQ